jgi:hypothetical protein
MAKTDRNSIFHGRDPHIPDWLYIMVSYMILYGFKKIQNFRPKSIGIGLQFWQKSGAVTQSDQGYKFLFVLKKFKIWLKIQKVMPSILLKNDSLR